MNCQAVAEAEKNMVFAARLTQRGHKINTMEDLTALYEKSFSNDTVTAISKLPHPTVQKFAVITVAIVGASRRFLAQITRHQNEVKFMPSAKHMSYRETICFASIPARARSGVVCCKAAAALKAPSRSVSSPVYSFVFFCRISLHRAT